MFLVLSLFLAILFQAEGVHGNDPTLVEFSLTCQEPEDFYELLYSICRQVILCRELYYMAPPGANMTALAEERDFTRFQYHLSLVRFFNTPLSDSIVSVIWPAPWAPNITVSYNTTGDSCSETFNQTSLDNIAFIYAVVDIMKT